jgi:DNA-binding NtrC family response regulator
LTMEELEKLAITKALDQCGGNRTHAAERLDISVRTLQRKLRQYELEKNRSGPNYRDVLTEA